MVPLRTMLDQATNHVVQLKQNVEEIERRKAHLEADNGGESSRAVGSMSPVLMVRERDSTLVVSLGVEQQLEVT
ncbi:hypothetical protein Acr_06g0002290 [Actinidia rufa]|uniref:Basic helix-loop-helix (BHLH) DNA-binding superfamily protein n=1 Tax=Actinidia rufa TaxID=165716 RepID=A0A7J0EQK2_9ERIC|nr:hypothetical protein Acr_06g0002290 [Actinidia rufa]